MNEMTLTEFINTELEDGFIFEEVLERFNLTPAEVFQHLFDTGLIDEEILESYILDIQ